MEISLKVENLTKIYQISHKNAGTSTLRESIESGVRNAVSVVLGRQQPRLGTKKMITLNNLRHSIMFLLKLPRAIGWQSLAKMVRESPHS